MNLIQKAVSKLFPKWLEYRASYTPEARLVNFSTGIKAVTAGGVSLADIFATTDGIPSIFAMHILISYYMRCAPVHNAIDLIASQSPQFIPMIAKEKKEKNPIYDHELLDLLRNPNNDTRTWGEFIKATVTYYLATGNAFFVASGAQNRPAFNLYTIRPQNVTITIAGDGYPSSYAITSLGYLAYDSLNTKIFNRVDGKDGDFRYVTKDGEHEIYHIKNVNPSNSSMMVYGMSLLQPLYFEIEQYIQSSVHNLSFLKRGAFPSGFFYSDVPVATQEQRERIEAQARMLYAGSSNAGRSGYLGDGMKYLPLTMPHRDMAFMEMRHDTKVMIYNTMRIPLPIVIPEQMTLANMAAAKLSLYDEAVIPTVDIIFDGLFNFLKPRYKGLDNNLMSYDEGTILALEPRKNENIKSMKEQGIYTLNEMRARAGAHPIDGGNVIYGASMQSLVAVDQTDANSLDEISVTDEEMNAGINDAPKKEPKQEPKKTEEEKEEADKVKTLEYYCDMMSKQLNADGTPRYTKKEIYELATKNGL